jgi:hypothetical protein
MEYEDFDRATREILQNNQQIKILFEPRRQQFEILSFIPYIAIGATILQPLPPSAIIEMQNSTKRIAMLLGNVKFGEGNYNIELFVYGFKLTLNEPGIKQAELQNRYLNDIFLNIAKGELWLGYLIFDFDEITRDIGTQLRIFIEAVPEYQAFIKEVLKKEI